MKLKNEMSLLLCVVLCLGVIFSGCISDSGENQSPDEFPNALWGVSVNTLAENVTETHALYPADMGRDGDTDLFALSDTDDSIVWFENDNGDIPGFKKHDVINHHTLSQGIRHIVASDLDTDFDIDLYAYTSDIYHYEMKTPDDFAESFQVRGQSEVFKMVLANISGDTAHGDRDLILNDDEGVRVLFTDPYSSTRKFRMIRELPHPETTDFDKGDIDGDGDTDIVLVSNRSNENILWYEYDDVYETFTKHQITSIKEPIESVRVKDFSGDGREDLLLIYRTDLNDLRMKIMINDGTPHFGTAPFVFDEILPLSYHLLLGDFDNNLKTDILIVDETDHTMTLFLNDTGLFSRAYRLQILSRPISKAVTADINGDGHTDLVVSSERDRIIEWYDFRPLFGRYQVVEGKTLSAKIQAATEKRVTYSIDETSPDAAFFTVHEDSGVFTFANAPLTSSPKDANGDNVYEAKIDASNGKSVTIRVSVTEKKPPLNLLLFEDRLALTDEPDESGFIPTTIVFKEVFGLDNFSEIHAYAGPTSQEGSCGNGRLSIEARDIGGQVYYQLSTSPIPMENYTLKETILNEGYEALRFSFSAIGTFETCHIESDVRIVGIK